MKAAYVTVFDPSDVNAWSGLGFHILSALRGAGFRTETIGSLDYGRAYVYKAKDVLYGKILSKDYHMLWDAKLLSHFASQVEAALIITAPDLVFSIWGNPIAYVKTDKPVVFWGDATFAGLKENYPSYRNLCTETARDANRAEQLALTKCRLAIYSSDWAAATAIRNYDVEPRKVKVVPFGANITCNRAAQDIQSLVEAKSTNTCKLLFVAKEWDRKGGDVAVQIALRLERRGIPIELHVVGCRPPGEMPAFVRIHGFISKTTEDGRRRLDDLFSQSHFFILPTRADCTPVVFPEAASFGLPVLTTNVGGIPTVIQDGINGFTFPPDASPSEYCDTIERLWSSRPEYERLAQSSFREYSERLNWETAGRKVKELVYQFCG